jgi:hypothetical protein
MNVFKLKKRFRVSSSFDLRKTTKQTIHNIRPIKQSTGNALK